MQIAPYIELCSYDAKCSNSCMPYFFCNCKMLKLLYAIAFFQFNMTLYRRYLVNVLFFNQGNFMWNWNYFTIWTVVSFEKTIHACKTSALQHLTTSWSVSAFGTTGRADWNLLLRFKQYNHIEWQQFTDIYHTILFVLPYSVIV